MKPGLAPTQVKRPYEPQPHPGAVQAFPADLKHRLLSWLAPLGSVSRHTPAAYGAAVLGVALASGFIAFIDKIVTIKNISLIYLLVVIWLAMMYGRGPAICASFLSFLAYDFFFIPPLYLFTVSDPTEWLSLSALLITSLVIGQITARVQARAEEALQSQREAVAGQRRIATLYSLAQLIASGANEDDLLADLATRVHEIFASSGIEASAILLPDAYAHPITRSIAPPESRFSPALSLDIPEHAAQAAWAVERGHIAGGKARLLATNPPLDSATPFQAHTHDPNAVVYFVPLRSRHTIVGVLGIAGDPRIRNLFVERLAIHAASAISPPDDTQTAPEAAAPPPDASSPRQAASTLTSNVQPQATLFAAVRSQITLALERLALQQEAIHSEALRESDRLKDALLSSITHDLRTPLASIQAAIGSLLEPDMNWSEADRREFLETIETSADRLNRLVSNILDLSRLEAGVALPEKRWYPFGDVVATVLDRLELAGRTTDRIVEVDIPEDLPLVPMDHAQMEQVLTNLIENAVKYSPAGSVIRIWVGVTRAGSELEMRVSDHGIGIPPNELQAIFTKFYRVQHVRLPWASARPPAGTGLGLAICAAIVEAHGGRIWAESAPGHGSTFIFTLPIPPDRPSGELPEIVPNAAGSPLMDGSPVVPVPSSAHPSTPDAGPAPPPTPVGERR